MVAVSGQVQVSPLDLKLWLISYVLNADNGR